MNKNNNKKIELLSPAGTYDAFLAAIHNGADAVYFAGMKYGARAFAGNFSEEDALKAIDYAHLYNKRVYMTVNTVLKEHEMNDLYDFILPFYIAGLDGVIVQDIGVIRFLNENFPEMELHASTQMSITDCEGVEFLKSLNICRVVTARELSLSEIKNIIDSTGIEVETFIHGAMCYCYSGKCLFSSVIGGRSGNRGRCAQPCRLLYNDTHPLSMKDMMGLNILPSLIEAGISSLKIEGRMKTPEYVACVTRLYRKYIDLYYLNPNEYYVLEEDIDLILNGYTRSGNCNGYYNQYNGKNMITFNFPGYNGDKNKLLDVDSNTYIHKLNIGCVCEFKINSRAKICLNFQDNNIEVFGEIVQKASKRPLDEDTIRRQICKTGDSCFEINEISLICDENIFMPIGQINDLRRSAIAKLKDNLLSKYRRNEKTLFDSNKLRYENSYSGLNSTTETKHKICAEITDLPQLKAVMIHEAVEIVVVPSYLLMQPLNRNEKISSENIDAVRNLLSNGKERKVIYLKLPYVLRNISEIYIQALKDIIKKFNIKGLFICNYEELQIIKELDFEGEVIADIHLYNLNSIARETLLSNGITNTVTPLELNKKELIARDIKNEVFNAYGRIPVMVSAQCVRKNMSKCTGKAGFFFINDRKNATIPSFCNCNECINVYYNSVPIFIERDDDILSCLRPKLIKLNFTDENSSIVIEIINYYSTDAKCPVQKYTKGHLNRGVE